MLILSGAVAGLALATAAKRLPHRLAVAAAVLAAAAACMVPREAITDGALFTISMVLMLLAGLLGLSEMIGVYAIPVVAWLSQPARMFFLDHYHAAGEPLTAILDNIWWLLIRVVAVSAVLLAAPVVPLSGRALRLRERLSGPWPSGLGAAVLTIFAVCCFGGTVALGLISPLGQRAAQIALIAAALALRIWRPAAISWGAWITAMLALAVVLQGLVLRVIALPYAAYSVLVIAAFLIAAVLLIAGPRPERRSRRWAWGAYVVVGVMPALGLLLRIVAP
ncbi:hypothetical protein [Dongia sp. agr-C8]